MEVNVAGAISVVTPIKTNSRNTWRDRTITAVIQKVSEHFGGRIMLRFRTANRRIREGGLIATGTLSGDEVATARQLQIPTLWIMAAETTQNSEVGRGQRFMYPTFVIPARFPSLFMFNRG